MGEDLFIEKFRALREEMGPKPSEWGPFWSAKKRALHLVERRWGKDHSHYQDIIDLGKGMLEDLSSSHRRLRNQLQLYIDDLELDNAKAPLDSGGSPDKQNFPRESGLKIFVVHGHDEEMKQAVARVFGRLGLQAIILHERPDQGRTVMEKFHDYSDVQFAVVLLSPDDVGGPRGSSEQKPRARQNVILELGFFLGKLGRSKVLSLFRPAPGFELPSDYAGVLFKPFDASGSWQLELCKELQAAGYRVDANKLLA